MLAPGRLPGLFQDPRIIAAAVANATTALTKGLSAANQKFVFMLIISSIRRTAFQIGLRIFPAPDLAKTDSLARSCLHETLELAERESPFDWALCSHGSGGDRVSRPRAPGADARSVLGGNRDSGCDAIHSWRYADALRRARRCHRRWRVSRSARVKLLRSESCCLHARDLFHRPTFVWLSPREDRLSICQCHPDDHCFDSANKSCVDRCLTSIH
jgi:hypothetical protein